MPCLQRSLPPQPPGRSWRLRAIGCMGRIVLQKLGTALKQHGEPRRPDNALPSRCQELAAQRGASAMKDDNFPGRRPGGCSGRCPRVFDPVGAKPAGPLRGRLVGKADGRRPAPVGCPDLRQPSPTRTSVIAPATRVRGGTPSPLIVVSGRPTFARSDHAAGERAGAIVPSRRHAQ